MTNRLRNILIGAVGIIVVLAGGLFSGALDGVLRQLNIAIAGHPAPVAESAGTTDVVATPAPAKSDTAAPATQAGETVVPVFDLVRVEPTGDAVIAGRSDPEAKVEILSGKDVVAGGKANDTGSWAIVLSDPLKPGAHDLSVRATDKDGKVASSDQSVAVSVPAGGNGDVLVVLNQPGSPSTVLQVPGLEEAQAKLADAGVEPPKADTAAAAPAAIAAAPPSTEVKPAEPAPAAAPAVEAAKPADQVVAAAPAAEAAKPADQVAAATPAAATPAAAATTETKPAEAAPAAAPAAPAAAAETVAIPAPPSDMLAAAAAPAIEAAPAAAAAEPATPAPAAEAAPAAPAAPSAATSEAPAAVPAPTITIDAVELENGTSFFAAGSAPNGSVIRVYVDDKPVGDTKTDKGRWLFQGKLELEAGKHLVRIDQIGADGKVLARAEVPFEIANDVLTAPTLASGVGSAQAGAGSSGETPATEPETLIIRRGDNLWMIAKRLYGKGIRYSTIYQANTDQIRNPDLIYPGQVFVIPKGDEAWKPVGQ